jgi:hypothetical protein
VLCRHCNVTRHRNAGVCPHDDTVKTSLNNLRTWEKLERSVIKAFGARCQCCGFRDRRILEPAHITGACNPRCCQKHGQGTAFYQWLVDNNFPKGFGLLCPNCIAGRFRNGGRCPHEEKRANSRRPTRRPRTGQRQSRLRRQAGGR